VFQNVYYPYGKVLREFVNTGEPEMHLTTQHQRDKDIPAQSGV
jgi:hypothetical protein